MREVRTIKDLVYYADERFGEEPFVREIVHRELQDTSYRQFRRDCDSLACWIQEKFPDQEKPHLALIGSTGYAYLTAWFGIQCANQVTVPLDVSNNAERIADEIARSDSEAVFLDDRHMADLEVFRKLCPNVKYYIHLHEKPDPAQYPDVLFLGDILKEYAGKIPEGMPEEKDLAAILFTSGTTGQSKGVMLSHENLIDNTTCEEDLGFHGNKRFSVLPVHHVYCFTCDILCSLWFGRTLCVNDSLMHIIKNLKKFRPTDATFVPMISASVLARMQQMAAKNPDKLAIGKEVFGEEFDILYSGGAYLSPEIIEGYREFGIEIAQGYGMTECSPRICSGVKNCKYPDSVGRIVRGCEVKISEEGEVWVKSKSVMMGYYHNPEETAKTLTEDGWLKTGDLGYQKDGYLYLTGRKKNLIILSNGENVSPEEIENQFVCFAPVKEIVVYEADQQIVAEIFPNPEYESEDIQKEIQAKIDAVNATFPPAKRIVKLVLRDTEFPKTASKKIIRAAIHSI
ncbi:MAG: AMP-binding protein [Oscillospiraceae bacterium]|nr:AMP-binding protein [Oscillospiraceae bacterium]